MCKDFKKTCLKPILFPSGMYIISVIVCTLAYCLWADNGIVAGKCSGLNKAKHSAFTLALHSEKNKRRGKEEEQMN